MEGSLKRFFWKVTKKRSLRTFRNPLQKPLQNATNRANALKFVVLKNETNLLGFLEIREASFRPDLRLFVRCEALRLNRMDSFLDTRLDSLC